MNHLLTKAIAWGCWKQRRDMGRIVFGYFKPTKSIGYTVLCDQGNGKDLVPMTIWDVHTKSLLTIAKDLSVRAKKAKTNTDEEFTNASKPFKLVPTCIMQPILHAITYCAANIGVSLPGGGVKPEQMGHVMISNIGTLGIEIGYAPLCSPTFCQLVVCFGAARKVPVYDELTDSIVAKQIITTIFTFDHRFGDAAVAAHSIKVA